MAKLKIYQIDDWTAAYINGRLINEGHFFSPDQLLRMIDEYLNIDWEIDYDAPYAEFTAREEDLEKIDGTE